MHVERVIVGAAALEAVVRFEPDEPLRTSQVPGMRERLLELLPGLSRHRCDNDAGSVFPAELRDTEIAHVLEHATVELMALAGSPRKLRGETSWDAGRDGRGVFHVTVAFDDDLVALGALKVGAALIGALLGGSEPPDVAREVGRLRGVRSRG